MSAVHHPSHYNTGQIEVIDAIDDWGLGFSLGNCVKYVARAEHKGRPLEDLEKAKWYLDHEIKRTKKKLRRRLSNIGIVGFVKKKR